MRAGRTGSAPVDPEWIRYDSTRQPPSGVRRVRRPHPPDDQAIAHATANVTKQASAGERGETHRAARLGQVDTGRVPIVIVADIAGAHQGCDEPSDDRRLLERVATRRTGHVVPRQRSAVIDRGPVSRNVVNAPGVDAGDRAAAGVRSLPAPRSEGAAGGQARPGQFRAVPRGDPAVHLRTQGAGRHGWERFPAVAPVSGIAAGLVFVQRQRRLEHPALLDLHLSGNGMFRSALTLMSVISVSAARCCSSRNTCRTSPVSLRCRPARSSWRRI